MKLMTTLTHHYRLWKSLEEGKMKGIAGSIREAQGEPAVVTRVAGYIFNQGRRKEHKRWGNLAMLPKCSLS